MTLCVLLSFKSSGHVGWQKSERNTSICVSEKVPMRHHYMNLPLVVNFSFPEIVFLARLLRSWNAEPPVLNGLISLISSLS
jgi:hypothetical protein